MSVSVVCDLCNKVRNADDMIACAKCIEEYEKKIYALEDQLKDLEKTIDNMRDAI